MRIRCIKNRLNLSVRKPHPETQTIAKCPEQHHHIGESEQIYEDVGMFLRVHQDDPATKARYQVHFLSELDTYTMSTEFHDRLEGTSPRSNQGYPTKRKPFGFLASNFSVRIN